MEGMIQKLKDYDGTASAIGYSVYYYASVMMGQPNLKFLQIDGVTPGNDTIGEGSYPLINDFYCVTRQDSPENALLIRDWLVSEQGQEFVEDCGYVAVGAQQK
jgi:phosphate transport system substrate-binding protein